MKTTRLTLLLTGLLLAVSAGFLGARTLTGPLPKSNNCPVGVQCPSDAELARKLGIKENELHSRKKEILKECSDFYSKLDCSNPDICVDGDYVVLKCRNSGKTVKTESKLKDFAD